MTTWGSLKTGCDPAVFARAVDLFARAADRFSRCENDRLDLVAFRTQARANDAVSAELAADLAEKNRAAFDRAADRFLRLGRAADALLDTEPFYRLGPHQGQALRSGDTPAGKGEKPAQRDDAGHVLGRQRQEVR